MTEKEKAKELVYKMLGERNRKVPLMAYQTTFKEKAKECALIVCDEKIAEFKEMGSNIMGLQFKERIKFHKKVRKEIEAL